MAEPLTLDFDGVDEADYLKVNKELGLDPKTGGGDWPAGLIAHVGGVSDAGHGYVIEVWESQQAPADFMNSRLGAAMAGGADRRRTVDRSALMHWQERSFLGP